MYQSVNFVLLLIIKRASLLGEAFINRAFDQGKRKKKVGRFELFLSEIGHRKEETANQGGWETVVVFHGDETRTSHNVELIYQSQRRKDTLSNFSGSVIMATARFSHNGE